MNLKIDTNLKIIMLIIVFTLIDYKIKVTNYSPLRLVKKGVSTITIRRLEPTGGLGLLRGRG